MELLGKIKTAFYQSFHRSPLRLKLSQPIFSFTFDDIPISAATTGAEILKEKEVSGTFYVSLNSQNDNWASLEQIQALKQEGHHIACHSYSHYRLSEGYSGGLVWDALKSKRTLEEQLHSTEIEHFAFPYGEVNLEAKKRLAAHYSTLRTTRPGINSGTIDLSFLKAVALYDRQFDEDYLSGLISEAARRCGWLIFYTHGVEQQPDQWGVKPEQLAWTIEQCRTRGEVLDIQNAYRYVKG